MAPFCRNEQKTCINTRNRSHPCHGIRASIGDGKNFVSGRQLAAWLELVPRQHSSGGKSVLLGISKRGDTYLRTLLIHGARAVIRFADNKPSATWLNNLFSRRNKNVAAVALANKNARVVWALLVHEEQRFRPDSGVMQYRLLRFGLDCDCAHAGLLHCKSDCGASATSFLLPLTKALTALPGIISFPRSPQAARKMFHLTDPTPTAAIAEIHGDSNIAGVSRASDRTLRSDARRMSVLIVSGTSIV
ncbi:hypothetical protein HNR39_003713 [Glaciimonas immobilis]|uniref:Transposase IS116/IS110/IS902 C-terminal domain-containing protein n=1 Tax=Glaciimonas immobilis TaxID=728004 RepID=A0A840RVG6_9BURK|nr:hypothetical protein [Glaciimonas immobilis]